MSTSFLNILFVIFLAGCSSMSSIYSNREMEDLPPEISSTIHYSVIVVIHGDGDYLYHDRDGNTLRADEKVLQEAEELGRQAQQGEVFIFHQQPARSFLWVIPRNNHKLKHYREGRLITSHRYRDRTGENLYQKESDLYNRLRLPGKNERSIFLYYGHEIPDRGGAGYYRSNPSLAVNSSTFSGGVRNFLAEDRSTFDLAVLSSCNNGSPKMVNMMNSVADVLLASPQNLHLSHIDTGALALLEQHPGMSGQLLAEKMASETFDRLEQFIQTEITLSVYDLEKVTRDITGEMTERDAGEMAEPAAGVETERAAGEETERDADEGSNVDCSEFSLFRELDFSKGVKTWYRSPRFGRNSHKKSHSGWGCRR